MSEMLVILVLLLVLVTACVAIHAVGVFVVLKWVTRTGIYNMLPLRISSMIWILARVVYGLLLVHLLQIFVWALCFSFAGCFDDFRTAFYFSATSYSTVGYGDVVPEGDWRLLGAIAGVTGVLMFGWSTGLLFSIVNQMMGVLKKQKMQREAPEGD